jgi:HlyD family secretion protein
MQPQDQPEVMEMTEQADSSRSGVPNQRVPAPTFAIRAYLRTVLKVLVLVLAIGAAVYWFRFKPMNVEAQQVSRGTVVAEVMGTGTLEAHISATVGAKISGRIAELKADQNDRVKKGQVLAVLDDSELKSQVEVASSALQTAQATLVRVKTDEARAEAVLELANINHERATKLQSQSAAAQLEVDTSREQLKVAQADVERSAAAIAEAEHQVVTAGNALRYQRTLLDNTLIASPFDGLIVRRDHVLGDVVAAGTCIFQIVSTDELWASVWVDETAMAGLSPSQPARILFRSQPGKEYPGAVVRLGREVDRQTREFLVDIQVQDLPANWAVGQRVDAYVATGRKENVLGLPYRLLAWKAGKPGVYVAKDGQAQWQPVKVGLKGLTAVEVVEGLSEGQSVVAAPSNGGQPTPLDGRRIALP